MEKEGTSPQPGGSPRKVEFDISDDDDLDGAYHVRTRRLRAPACHICPQLPVLSDHTPPGAALGPAGSTGAVRRMLSASGNPGAASHRAR